jgi:hypothetical protein
MKLIFFVLCFANILLGIVILPSEANTCLLLPTVADAATSFSLYAEPNKDKVTGLVWQVLDLFSNLGNCTEYSTIRLQLRTVIPHPIVPIHTVTHRTILIRLHSKTIFLRAA